MPAAPLDSLRVLISGAGVAGPALALRLAGHGARVTVVELAPAPRTSGFAVDFRGPTHLAVLRRLGILDELRAHQTHGTAMTCVDEQDQEIFSLPAAFTGGDLEVARRDLSQILYARRAATTVDYRFGDTVTALHDTGPDVRVTFRDGAPRTFDLVVGADGMHSTVRRLAFGDEHRFLRPLGHYIAGWDLPNSFGLRDAARHFNVPGRLAALAPHPHDPSRATAMTVFHAPGLQVDWHDQSAQRKLIAHRYADLPWHVPTLLNALPEAPDLYFDAIAKVSTPSWTRGRTALLGDAAWGVTLGGMGVGTALVGAHVLAGELALTPTNLRAALTTYEHRMRQYAARWQKSANPGRFLAPTTRRGLSFRNRLLARPTAQRLLLSTTSSLATAPALPTYP